MTGHKMGKKEKGKSWQGSKYKNSNRKEQIRKEKERRRIVQMTLIMTSQACTITRTGKHARNRDWEGRLDGVSGDEGRRKSQDICSSSDALCRCQYCLVSTKYLVPRHIGPHRRQQNPETRITDNKRYIQTFYSVGTKEN